jgi:hypothetical protein
MDVTRQLIAALALPALLFITACGSNNTVKNDEGTPAPAAANAPMVASLKMNDPSAKQQLTKGFYALESTWRWTAGNFTAVLKVPPGAAQKGATLTLTLVASDAILKQVHSQSLTAAVGTTNLKTEKYVDPGSHTFTADVPASVLTGDTVTVDFSLDNALPPSGSDRRELGVIATGISLDTN